MSALVLPVECYTSGNETALRSVIFNGYDTGVRPDAVTDVVMTFLPTSLGEISVKDSTMQITGWWIMVRKALTEIMKLRCPVNACLQHWNDSRLTWDAASYDNIDETHVYQHEVWTPPVIVYNSCDVHEENPEWVGTKRWVGLFENSNESQKESSSKASEKVDNLSAVQEDTIPLRVSSSGTVHWSPPAILTVSCATDITYFPFDTQTCPISVTTFGFTINEMTVSPVGVDTSFYSLNGEWELRTTYTESNPAEYSYVSFQFVFRRKPAYYGLNFVMPVLMCWILSVLIFLLPAECGEKMGYSLTVFLAFVLLITLLADRMPTTADHVSYLGGYCVTGYHNFVFDLVSVLSYCGEKMGYSLAVFLAFVLLITLLADRMPTTVVTCPFWVEVYIILVLGFCGFSVAYTILNLAVYFRAGSETLPPWVRRFTLAVTNLGCACRRSDRVSQLPQNADKMDSPPLSQKSRKWDGKELPNASTESDDVQVTWKMVATELDAFVFKVYFSLTALLSFVLLCIVGFHY
ncbi:neuronal acetylcholine receptor subunit alpha-6-like [Littorina saxatilis]|uniref:neuronal acetylcholine receptor subunit alpha-6-like n=1 Tax=Littorina saxatilis TaxID=31220 RepID=UPI0038B5184E